MEILEDDIIDYESEPVIAEYEEEGGEGDVFEFTTTGASVEKTESRPEVSAVVAEQDEQEEENSKVEFNSATAVVPILVLENEKEKIAPDASVVLVEEKDTFEIDYTTTGSPLGLQGELDFAPIVAELEDDLQNVFGNNIVAVEFDQTTTGSPFNNQNNNGNGQFDIEPVVAESDDENNIIDDFLENVAIEFSETTTGSPILRPKVSKDELSPDLLDVTPMLNDQDTATTEETSTIKSNVDNIVFYNDDVDDYETNSLNGANDGDAMNYDDEETDINDNDENIIFNFEQADSANEETAEGLGDQNETATEGSGDQYETTAEGSGDLYETVRIVVDPEVTVTTSREVVSITEFVKKYQTTTSQTITENTADTTTSESVADVVVDDTTTTTTKKAVDVTAPSNSITENDVDISSTTFGPEAENSVDLTTTSESESNKKIDVSTTPEYSENAVDFTTTTEYLVEKAVDITSNPEATTLSAPEDYSNTEDEDAYIAQDAEPVSSDVTTIKINFKESQILQVIKD